MLSKPFYVTNSQPTQRQQPTQTETKRLIRNKWIDWIPVKWTINTKWTKCLFCKMFWQRCIKQMLLNFNFVWSQYNIRSYYYWQIIKTSCTLFSRRSRVFSKFYQNFIVIISKYSYIGLLFLVVNILKNCFGTFNVESSILSSIVSHFNSRTS